jgi:hypothetical protein
MDEKNKVDKVDFSQKLNDASKLIIEVHYKETEVCTAFILLRISKRIKSVLIKTKSGE